MTASRAAVRRRVTVVGGGLAGITAALRCADAGCDVTLHEARPRLGGQTHSFRRRLADDVATDHDDGFWVDNGQHVFLRCCTAYEGLLERLGVARQTTVQDRLDIAVRTNDGVAHLRRGGLPAPLHLASSLLRFPLLAPSERIGFARAARALARVDAASPAADASSFGEWLRDHGQSEHAVTALWDLVGVAALNARADDASLALAATVFQRGLLREPAAGDIGWSTVPLQQLHGDAAETALAAAGAHVCLRSKVEALAAGQGRWHVVTATGIEPADVVVLAAPPAVTARLLPAGALDVPAGWASSLGASPIVNLHLLVDRRVLVEPFLAGIAATTPGGRPEYLWVFDRTTLAGLGGTRLQYLAVSLSAADELVDLPSRVLRQRFTGPLESMLPGLAHASVLDFFVTREREATFRPGAGSNAVRPGTSTRLPRLHLAGAWTATGWPATMEGAVRSGDAAARAVLASPPVDTAARGRVVA
ncbi:MAG TPA: hydroxysqualene dehydroxylase HpnE [Actinomycetales bacterium]|nr:hydroxysqualene dehydroxylase HpnE [Actinomycetales bacterium]